MLKLKKLLPLAAILVASSAIAQSGSGAVQFSNVTVTGSLSNGTTWSTGSNDIDFTFNNAVVDDGQATRSGNLVITYEARSDSMMTSDELTIGILRCIERHRHGFL